MILTRRTLMAATAASLPLVARAQTRPVIKIGVLNDMSGPYRDATGMGSVACVQQAVRQFNSTGFDVQVLAADHQNKPDVGAAVARQWFDRDGVDVIMDVPTSSVALAVNTVAKEKNKLYINNGGGTGDLTGEQCTPVTHPLGLRHLHAGQVDRVAGDQARRQQVVLRHRRLRVRPATGARRDPFREGGRRPASWASSATRSRPPRISPPSCSPRSPPARTCWGWPMPAPTRPTASSRRTSSGCMQTMKVAALLMEITDVQAIGTEIGAGLYVSATFYWDASEGTRA